MSNEQKLGVQQIELLKTFTSMCHRRNISVFVIEQAVLQYLLSANGSDAPCTLCSVGDVITLGVFGSDWEGRGTLDHQLNDKGIVLNEMTSPDPRLLSLKRLKVPSIPTHYIILQSGSIPLHLVVFYKRDDDYWWHSSIENMGATNGQNLPGLHLTFGKSAGAYDSFHVALTVVDGLWLQLPYPVETFLVQMRKAKFIECDYQGAQAYLRANTPKSNNVTPNWAQVLLKAKRALDHIDVPFRICYGTCLGWYRQCGFIPYTNDIDIDIPIQNYSPNTVPAFLQAGFKVNVKGKISDNYQMSINAGSVRMDVYFIYEEETYCWVGTTDRLTGQKYKKVLPKSGTCWTDFMGFRVRVPCPTLPYITANYGQNWNTSVEQWKWKTQPNTKSNGMVPKEELHSVVHRYQQVD
ncbi:ribitol-5-phosphate transferase FKTN-like [Haliotis asinina]|uniref:ribitol-5-phosphate transferase FKTN-like n=1 Tax=Haliotis asinina TaxID=109174 RepID=UPI003532276F